MGFLSALKGIGKAALPFAAGMIPGIGGIAGPAVKGMMDRMGNKGIGPSQMPGQQQQPFMGPQQQKGGFMQKLGGMFPGQGQPSIYKGNPNMGSDMGPGGIVGNNPQGGLGGWMQKLMQQMQQRGSAPPYIMNQQNPGINPRAQQGPMNTSVPQGRSMRMPNLTNSIEQGRREYNNPQMRQQPTMY